MAKKTGKKANAKRSSTSSTSEAANVPLSLADSAAEGFDETPLSSIAPLSISMPVQSEVPASPVASLAPPEPSEDADPLGGAEVVTKV